MLWPPNVKSWLIGKEPDAGKDWGQEEKGTTEDDIVGWHHQLKDMGLGGLQELVIDGEAWRAVVHGVAKSQTQLNDWTELNSFQNLEPVCCSMFGSNYCFLTCIQVSQETGKMVWYCHPFKNFPQSKAFEWSRSRCFSEIPCFLSDPTNVGCGWIICK